MLQAGYVDYYISNLGLAESYVGSCRRFPVSSNTYVICK